MKPIITTEGPGYVHLRFLPCCKDQSMPCFSCPRFLEGRLPARVPRVWVHRIRFPFLRPGGHTLRSACRPSARVAGCDRRAMGPTNPRTHGGGKAHYLRTHALTLRHHTAQAHGYGESPAPKGKGGKAACRYFGLVSCGSSEPGRFSHLARHYPPNPILPSPYRFPTPPATRGPRYIEPVAATYELAKQTKPPTPRLFVDPHCNCAADIPT